MHETAFLVRVADADEATMALAHGADRIGLTDARGPLSIETVAAIVATVERRCPVSASPQVLGERDSREACGLLAKAGVDILEFANEAGLVERFAALRAKYPALGAVVTFRPDDPTSPLGQYAEAGFQGAVLKGSVEGVRLIEVPGIETLSAFVDAAQRRGLTAWIGGALEAPDVPRLLALAPDVLAFRRSVCHGGKQNASLDPARIALMRDLIPRGMLPGRGEIDAQVSAQLGADKVFVRDFVVQAGIGAYRFEHRAPQRMRFNVEADLAPIPTTVADMRDVFSYDVIVDAIRLATRRHVLLVERVALDVAEATLRDPRVKRVRVRVEKLDILDGSVGVEIERSST